MKCKWCRKELYLQRDELGGGMMTEKTTNKQHLCKPFLKWEKSKNLHGPTLSWSRYQLWSVGPKEANRRLDLQEGAKKPILPFVT